MKQWFSKILANFMIGWYRLRIRMSIVWTRFIFRFKDDTLIKQDYYVMMDDNTKKLKLIKEITTKNSIETEKQKSSIIKDELIKTLDYGIACHFVDRIEKRFDTKVKLTEIKDERKQTISS